MFLCVCLQVCGRFQRSLPATAFLQMPPLHLDQYIRAWRDKLDPCEHFFFLIHLWFKNTVLLLGGCVVFYFSISYIQRKDCKFEFFIVIST